jgi:hypothetical protein
MSRRTIKGAAIPGNIPQGLGAVPATFGSAQVLIRSGLPLKMQRRICLRINQEMISISSHCIGGGMDDIELGNHTRTSRAHHQG